MPNRRPKPTLVLRRPVLGIATGLALTSLPGSQAQAVPLYRLTNLGTLGGATGIASAINDRGQIIGRADTAAGLTHAALFDPTGAGDNRDLGTLGGDRSRANAINAADQIVGSGEFENIFTAAFLLTPIERVPGPAPLGLLAIGLAGLGQPARRRQA